MKINPIKKSEIVLESTGKIVVGSHLQEIRISAAVKEGKISIRNSSGGKEFIFEGSDLAKVEAIATHILALAKAGQRLQREFHQEIVPEVEEDGE